MHGLRFVAKVKTPTTEDVTGGITTALRHILHESGTATDIAVAAGVAKVGDRSLVAYLDAGLVRAAMARIQAVAAGADPATIQIVNVEDVPLAYLPGNATRIRVKAVGDLRLSGKAPTPLHRGGEGQEGEVR